MMHFGLWLPASTNNAGDHKELRASAKAVRHRPEILKLSGWFFCSK